MSRLLSSIPVLFACALEATGCQRPVTTPVVEPSVHPAPQREAKPASVPVADLRPAGPATIDAARMWEDLERLASDELAGRNPWDAPSIQAAAQLIAEAQEHSGLEAVANSYRIPFKISGGFVTSTDQRFVWIDGPHGKGELPTDAFVPISKSRFPRGHSNVVVAGQDLSAHGLASKVVLLPANPGPGSAWSPQQLHDKLTEIDSAGALSVMVLGAPGEPLPTPEQLGVAAKADIYSIFVKPEALADWTVGGTPLAEVTARANDRGARVLAVDGTPSVTMSPVLEQRQNITGENVVAFMRGTDLADEVVIIGAHYDHIGVLGHQTCRGSDDPSDTICNGADDNASGSAVVLAVARAFGEAGYRPRRTLVFVHFSAEEMGLHGSRALANDPPDSFPFAGTKTVAMVNVDMVGRATQGGLQVLGTETSSAWQPMLERRANPKLSVSYPPSVGRSDHVSFHALGVPVVHFFTGEHEDYHRTSDNADKIDQAGLREVASLVLAVSETLETAHPSPRSRQSRYALLAVLEQQHREAQPVRVEASASRRTGSRRGAGAMQELGDDAGIGDEPRATTSPLTRAGPGHACRPRQSGSAGRGSGCRPCPRSRSSASRPRPRGCR